MTDEGSNYAHDAHCNTIHTPGPDPCPPARDVAPLDAAVEAAARALVNERAKTRLPSWIVNHGDAWDSPPVPASAAEGWRESFRREVRLVLDIAAPHLRGSYANRIRELQAELNEARALVRQVNLYGTAYEYRVGAGRPFLLDPSRLVVFVAANAEPETRDN